MHETDLWCAHSISCNSDQCTCRKESTIWEGPILKRFSAHDNWSVYESSDLDQDETGASQLVPPFNRWDSFKKLSILRNLCKATLFHPNSPITLSASSRNSFTYSGWIARSYIPWVKAYDKYPVRSALKGDKITYHWACMDRRKVDNENPHDYITDPKMIIMRRSLHEPGDEIVLLRS